MCFLLLIVSIRIWYATYVMICLHLSYACLQLRRLIKYTFFFKVYLTSAISFQIASQRCYLELKGALIKQAQKSLYLQIDLKIVLYLVPFIYFFSRLKYDNLSCSVQYLHESLGMTFVGAFAEGLLGCRYFESRIRI